MVELLVPELGLLPELILLADAAPLALMPEPELELPIDPDEPEPEAAVFIFGCPVALSRQWVAGETEDDPELVLGELDDCAAAASTVPPRKTDVSNTVLHFIEHSFGCWESPTKGKARLAFEVPAFRFFFAHRCLVPHAAAGYVESAVVAALRRPVEWRRLGRHSAG